LTLGAQGIKKDWRMKSERKSAAYTTRLDSIPIVR